MKVYSKAELKQLRAELKQWDEEHAGSLQKQVY
jgi:hypothetical protein